MIMILARSFMAIFYIFMFAIVRHITDFESALFFAFALLLADLTMMQIKFDAKTGN